MLLSMAERRLAIAERLAHCFPDRRDPSRITHTLADMIRARVFTIAFGYEDANDLGVMRTDRVFKLACGRLPDTDAATAMHFQGSPANRASSSRAAFSSSKHRRRAGQRTGLETLVPLVPAPPG